MVIYDSYIDAGQELSKRDREAFYTAVIEFVAYGREPELNGAPAAIFIAVRPSLEESRTQRGNGRKGGRPRKPKTPKTENPNSEKPETQNAENGKPKTPKTENPNSEKPETQNAENGKARNRNRNRNRVIEPPLPPFDDSAGESAAFLAAVLDAWNEETGQSVVELPGTTELRIGHLRERGVTVDGIRATVRKVASAWRDDPKMSRFIRPSTVFGEKYDEYANMPEEVDDASPYDNAW